MGEEVRDRLPNRRPSVTKSIRFSTEYGSEKTLQITFGFARYGGPVREVFTASFKAGSDTHAIVADACILLSTLMQHGYSARQLAAKLSDPPSLIGTVAQAAAQVDAAQETLAEEVA